jgi:hypothetical protein
MKKLLAIAVVSSFALTACGGGGGGGGGGLRADATPVQSTAGSASEPAPTQQAWGEDNSTPVALPPPNNPGGYLDLSTVSTATAVPLGSYATVNTGAVTPQITMSSPRDVRVRIAELGVDETFAQADIQSTQTWWGGVEVATAQRGAGTKQTLMYNVPSGDGFNLRYSSLGIWDQSDVAGNITQSIAMSYGSRTLGTDIPTTGTANYVGVMLGNAIEGAGQSYSVNALATATADFGARNVALSTSGSVLTHRTTGAISDGSGYNLSGTLTYPAATNALSGTLTTANGKTGQAVGHFYGPQAAELGVTFKLNSAGGTQPFVGGAALKR